MPVRQLNPGMPARLEEIVHKALEKNRDLRYHHASEMRADLQRLERDLESGHSSSTSAVVVETSLPVRGGRHWKFAILVLLSAALIAGGLYDLAYRRSHQNKLLTDKDTIILSDFATTHGRRAFRRHAEARTLGTA